MKKNKIFFEPFQENTVGTIDKVYPSKKFIPEWYKQLPKEMIKNGLPLTPEGQVNRTMKSCIPVLDAITAGYMITLPYDVFITRDANYNFLINWNCEWVAADRHPSEQISLEMIPEGYEKQALKWNNPWIIKTPPGWSTLFVHPLNRNDLPFLTLSGIVDTDLYQNGPVNFPFFLKNNFEGIIRNGTPIAQAIPIKRESWKSEEKEYSGIEKRSQNFLRKFLVDSYKKQFWFRKDYS